MNGQDIRMRKIKREQILVEYREIRILAHFKIEKPVL